MVGGAGHVGSVLALLFADAGRTVVVHDANRASLAALAAGRMPFADPAAQTLLARVAGSGRLTFSAEPDAVRGAVDVVLAIDTPATDSLTRCVERLLAHLDAAQCVIVRSTVFPGSTDALDAFLRAHGRALLVAACPDRSLEGASVAETGSIPQLVGGVSEAATERAATLFRGIVPEIVAMSAIEAEYAKLICNAFRYIQFAATNELCALVESAGVDYRRLLAKATHGYPRMASIPRPGFAGGPCLVTDTTRLVARHESGFSFGRAALAINQGLPAAIVARLERERRLAGCRVGILGMAFKAGSDDARGSLSYVLRDLLQARGAVVTCSDECVADPGFVAAHELIAQVDVVVVAVPHHAYAGLQIPPETLVIDTCGGGPG